MIELKPHQAAAVEKLSDGKVLTGDVGSGKTHTALVYFYTKVMGGTLGDPDSITNPMDLYVFTTARKRDDGDWQRVAAQLIIGPERAYSIHGIKLTVDSYNNIQKYKDIKNAYIILDEQRMVGSGTWTKTFLSLAKSNRWIMLSATPGDVWEDYIPLFVANGFYKNRSQFKREHCVYSYYGRYPKLERYLSVSKLVRLKNSILVEMPFERHTTRHIHTVPVDYDKELFDKVVKKRWHVYEDRPLTDVSEMFSVMRKVVNSDESRVQEVWSLLQTHPRLIVFYNFDYELEQLRSLARTTYLSLERSVDVPLELNASAAGKYPTIDPTDTTIISKKIGGTGSSIPTPSQSPLQAAQPRKKLNTNGAGGTAAESTSTSIRDGLTPEISVGGLTSKIPENNSKKHLESSLKNGSGTISNTSDEVNDSSPKVEMDLNGFQIAEWNGHKHEPVPTTDRWIYLVQYVAGAEAWNCVETDTIVFYSMTYSYRNFMQAQGRIDRMNTPYFDLNYYILKSKSPIDNAIARALASKKDFNEKDYLS